MSIPINIGRRTEMMPYSAHGNSASSPRSSGRAGERGVALLVVLWIIAAASLLVMTFNATVRSGLSFVHAEVGLSRSEAVLNAGAEIAVARLIDEDPGSRWLPDGRSHTVKFAGHELRVRISDPNGLIDLNKASEPLLLEFFKQFTITDSVARALRDKIKAARDAAEKVNNTRGAMPTQPQTFPGSDLGAPPRTPAFVDAGQARHLDGMSADLYQKVSSFLTVYSADGSINPLTAPEEVLRAEPQLRGLDFTAKREAFLAGRLATSPSDNQGNQTLEDTDRRGGFGPAYVIEVESAATGERYAAKKTIVVAIGLDGDAPYRTLAVK